MEYKIVTVADISIDRAINELEEKVNNLIKTGWKPIGGISIIAAPYGTYHKASQAMIKE